MATPLFGSDDSRKSRRRLADTMLMQGMDASPVGHWTQGLARIGQALAGGYINNQVSEEEKSSKKALRDIMLNHPGLRDSTAAPTVPPGSPPANAGSTPALAERPGQGALGEASPVWREYRAPVRQGTVTSPYGERVNPVLGKKMMHEGTDIGAAGDTPVYASAPGRIAKMGTDPVNGKFIVVQHPDGRTTSYSHLSMFGPYKEGDVIADPSNEIGYVGSTGRSTGNHLHFGVRDPSGRSINPEGVADVRNAGVVNAAALPAARNVAPTGSQVAEAPPASPVNDASGTPPQMRAYIKSLIESGEPQAMALGNQLLTQYSTPEKPTDEMREYNLAVRQGETRSFTEWKKAMKAPLVTIDQRGESEFDKATAKNQAERFDKIIASGSEAKSMVASMQALREIASRITTGKTSELKAALGPYAEMVGIKIDGLDDLQAYKAIVAKLAPTMRVAGSGATSDFEMRMFLEALPGLGKTPGGNELIARTLDAIAEHKVAAAEIASKAMTKEITRAEAEKQLRDLPDPLALWKKSRGKTGALDSGERKTESPVLKFNPRTGRIE